MAIAKQLVALPDLRRWSNEIVSLETNDVLPARVVLVPSEAHAHALRVELAGRAPRALAGTHFFTAAAAARTVLEASGVPHSLGEEVRRPLRLRELFRSDLELKVYRPQDLASPGWEDAFASTIEQLEKAALRPGDLDALDDPRVSDLATIWRALDADAGSSWTLARVMEKARELLQGSGTWPFDAPVLAAVPAVTDTAHARFLLALPRLTLGVVPGRPARRRAVERIRWLFGDEAAQLVVAVPASVRTDELGLLADHLFDAPERLAARARRRSSGPDGSVTLERYAGADEEIDAAARWIAEEVFDYGTRLQGVAVLVPNADPLCALLAARIRALPWDPDVEPVYLACGEAAVSVAAGARLLSVLRALQGWLPAEAMVEIAPRLRLEGSEDHLTPERARALIGRMGTCGGSSARPADALRWRARIDVAEGAGPAITALVEIAEAVLAGASIERLWKAIETFVDVHLIAARNIDDVVSPLRADVLALAADRVTAELVGMEALDLIVARLKALRLHHGRYGDPAIYVGTVAGAAGLRFSAVRILGLAEGAFPGTQREDAILPASSRGQLPTHTLASDDDYATARLHTFDQVIRGVTQRLVLSAPQTDLDGSEREPAALFIEVGAALARPNADTGDAVPVIPAVADLERDAFAVARGAARSRRARAPLSRGCWLARVAGDASSLPSAWARSIVVDPREVAARTKTMDGILGAEPLTVSVPGGAADRPLSASSLRALLTCPQQFLLERVLRFRPRGRRTEGHRIDPAAYGALFHSILETFSRAHGAAFGARERSLDEWHAVAHDLATSAFETFLIGYALDGAGAVASELRRLLRDVRTFIEDDWDQARPRTFVAAERAFGKESAFTLEVGGDTLYLAGRIDRIDIENGLTLVRDFKTGRARTDDAEPDVALDLQLVVYAAVARERAEAWGVPDDIAAAYAYVDPFATHRERAFRANRDALKRSGGRWLEIAASLLREQAYVKTPVAKDCSRCAFAPVCGEEAATTADRLQEAVGASAAFRDLKS